MYVTLGLWIAVTVCALAFAGSGFWQAWNRHATKPALASGSPLAFGLAMVLFATLCVLKALEVVFL